MLQTEVTVLVVEVVSPQSERIDYVVKHGEYADAGIPHYWVIDLESSESLTAYRLVNDFGYQDDGEFRGRCTTDTPFTITLPLAELRRT